MLNKTQMNLDTFLAKEFFNLLLTKLIGMFPKTFLTTSFLKNQDHLLKLIAVCHWHLYSAIYLLDHSDLVLGEADAEELRIQIHWFLHYNENLHINGRNFCLSFVCFFNIYIYTLYKPWFLKFGSPSKWASLPGSQSPLRNAPDFMARNCQLL